MSSQVLVANEVLTTNKVDSIEDGNESIEKYRKLLKIEKLSKSGNLKGETLSKSKKHLALEHAFILLRLVFTDIWIEENNSLRYWIQNLRCRAFGLVQASRFGGFFPKAISKNQNSFKPDYFAMLSSFVRPSKRPSSTQYIT